MIDFRLKHDEITNDLFNFVIKGNGILTGNPGAGKSYEITKLVRYLQKYGHPVLFLPVDKIIAESDVDLQKELDLKTDLFDYIASNDQVTPSKKGIVIIDAFDAARSGNKRNFYIKLIRKIIAKIGAEWNVLVVVRMYDAKKSTELLNILSKNTDTDHEILLKILKTSKEIPCRHVILPELNSDDLTAILVKHPVISKYANDFNPRLKKLLLNPFYISLIIHLIETEKNSIKIKSVYSEIQLLDLYWTSRIESNQSEISYEILLTKLTDAMIKTHSLSIPFSELPEFSEANITYLLSTGILTNVGVNKNKIAYSHNILFDYSVSRLAIDDSENGLIQFISEDKSNIIFLKPSLRYYLTKIWFNDRELFKKISLKLYKAKENKISLLAKIMPTQVLVHEADSNDDIKFISNLYDRENEYRNWLHATIFSTLESLESETESQGSYNRKFWLNYFEQIVENSKNPYDFNFVGWLATIQKEETDPDMRLQIGRISRKILSTCLELRKTNPNPIIEGFTSHLPVILVVKTFSTDPHQSRKLLEKIFEIAQEPDFELSYLFSLAYNIREIFPFDQEFVSKLYVFIFSRTEESTKQTELGGTSLFRLTSNRRQDFQGIRYHLGQEAGALLDSNLKMGLRTLIRSVNYGICREELLLFPNEGHSIQENVKRFQFNKKESKFLEDHCYIWSDSYFHTEPESEILTQIKNRLIKISGTPVDKPTLEIALNEFRDNAVVSILWRELLKVVSSNPEPFSDVIPDLLCAKPLQMHSETLNEVAELIEASVRFLPVHEVNRIITSILNSFNEIDDADYKKYLQEKRNFLLSKIPSKFFPTDELKREIEEYASTHTSPPRKPIEISETKVGFISEEDILEFKKIDPNVYENRSILPNISLIKKFNDKWINEKISEADAYSILNPFKELYTLVEKEKLVIPSNTIYYAWEELSRCAKIIAKGIENSDSELFDYSCNVLLKSAALITPYKKENFPPDYDPLSWSPTPITNAAEGLFHLYSIKDDDAIRSSIKGLSRHENPVVRSIIALDLVLLFEKHPDQYWKMIDAFIKEERNYKIHELICHSLNNAFRISPSCISDVKTRLKAIWEKSEKLDGLEGLKIINNNCFITSVSYFAFVDETKWAIRFCDDIIHLKQYSTIRPKVVSLIINQFFKAPTILNSKYGAARSLISEWLKHILTSIFEEIHEFLLTKPQLTEDEKKQVENHYGVIEQYITRFFFVVDKKYNKITDPDESVQAIGLVYKLECNTFSLILDSLIVSDQRLVLRGDEMQYMMGILDSCLGQDPEKVLELTVKTLKIGHRIGYSSDYSGKTEIQKFIGHLLADHRDILEGETAMNNFTELLENYAKGNSPEAIKYIMSIDLEYN